MDVNKIKELLKKSFGKEKDDKYHAAAMLIIYGIFLAILVIFIRTSPVRDDNKNTSSNGVTSVSKKEIIDNDDTKYELKKDNTKTYSSINYSYIYTINDNGKKEIFTGKKVDNKEIFTFINDTGSNDYAKLSDNYLIKENGEYHIVDSPSKNLVYFDMDKIASLAENSELVRNDNIYNYSVNSSDIYKMFGDDGYTFPTDMKDSIIITTNDGVIKQIDINFSNYYSYIYGNGTFTITMEFNNVGTTESFDIKISN